MANLGCRNESDMGNTRAQHLRPMQPILYLWINEYRYSLLWIYYYLEDWKLDMDYGKLWNKLRTLLQGHTKVAPFDKTVLTLGNKQHWTLQKVGHDTLNILNQSLGQVKKKMFLVPARFIF